MNQFSVQWILSLNRLSQNWGQVHAHPAVSAPIAGVAHRHHVDNLAAAILERRKLDKIDKAELDKATTEMWARTVLCKLTRCACEPC